MTPVPDRLNRALWQALARYVRHRPMAIEQRLSAMRTITERARPELFAGQDLTRYEYRVFSQNGEDGVVVEVLNRIGVTNRYFVEFGIQTGHEGNCVLLADVFGWSGLFIEADPGAYAQLQAKYRRSPSVRAMRAKVTAATIESIFRSAGVPAEPDVLSIDVDGNDVYLWQALVTYRPRLLVIEYNSELEGDRPLAQPMDEDRGWDGTAAFGSSLAALNLVAQAKGYRHIHSDLAGVNAFYLRADLLGLLGAVEPPGRGANFGLTGGRHPASEPAAGWSELPEPPSGLELP